MEAAWLRRRASLRVAGDGVIGDEAISDGVTGEVCYQVWVC